MEGRLEKRFCESVQSIFNQIQTDLEDRGREKSEQRKGRKAREGGGAED